MGRLWGFVGNCLRAFSVCTFLIGPMISTMAHAFMLGPLGIEFTSQNPLGLEQPKTPQKFLRPSVRLGLCSGTLISNSGHVLTALHCLNQQDITVSSEQFQHIGWGQATLQFPILPALLMMAPKSRYTVMFEFTHDLNRSSVRHEAQVLATGAAYAMSFPVLDDDSVKQSAEQVRLGQELLHDFALIKVSAFSAAQTGFSYCARIAADNSSSSNEYWTVGYPAFVGESDEKLDLSGLPVIHPAKRRADLKSDFESVLPSGVYDTFQSRIRVGLSGGGVFNSQGELFAINAFQDRDSGQPAMGFSAKLVAYRAAEAIKRLKAALPPQEASEAFDCP